MRRKYVVWRAVRWAVRFTDHTRCTVGCGAPGGALRPCPWLSDIDRARLSDERLAVRVALCGSCRERFAARRVREYVSSDVSLCTSYQS